MIIGTYSVPKVVEESKCRNSLPYKFSKVGDYKIHSTVLIPNTSFEEALTQPDPIDHSIFINDDETKLLFDQSINNQNFLTVKYIGKCRSEEDPDIPTGTEFILICHHGLATHPYMIFGTEDAIRGYAENSDRSSG